MAKVSEEMKRRIIEILSVYDLELADLSAKEISEIAWEIENRDAEAIGEEYMLILDGWLGGGLIYRSQEKQLKSMAPSTSKP